MSRIPLALVLALLCACEEIVPTTTATAPVPTVPVTPTPVTPPGPTAFPVFALGRTAQAHALGDPNADLLAGALAADASDNLYFTGNANEWGDGFSENLAVARQNADGTLGWAKEWNEDHEQLATDSGQNGSTGGTPGSIDVAGDGVYTVFHRSQSATNNTFQSVVARIDSSSGDLVWVRGFSPANVDPPNLAWHSSDPYAVDASLPDRVLVAGTSLGNVEVFAVSKSDGSLLWAKQLDIVTGSNDRAHALSVDAAGNAWLGGSSAGRGFLARLTGVDGAAPALDFVHELDLGVGSQINHLVGDGPDVFASLDLRGVDTSVAFARFDATGAVTWAKSYRGAPGDRNNTYVVRPDGVGGLYVGGRIAVETADEAFGDGLLLRVNAADGAYDWGTFYYTGVEGQAVEHRVKGLHVTQSGDLRMLLASHTVNGNLDHYEGSWFRLMDDPEAGQGDGATRLTDLTVPSTDLTATSDWRDTDGSNGTNIATLHPIDTTSIWRDAPTAVTYGPLEDRVGDGVDGDAVILGFTLD